MIKIKHLVLLLALVLCLTNTVYANSINQVDNAVTVTGSAAAGSDVRLKVTDSAGELAWIDSTSANVDGAYSFNAKLPIKDTGTKYKLLVNGTEVSEITVLSDGEVEAFFASATASNVEALLTTYGARLGIDLTDGYEAAERTAVNSIFLKNVGTRIEDIATSFTRSVAVNKINSADRSSLGTILKSNATVLNIQYETEVEALSSKKQEAFIIAMLEKTYEDYDAFLNGYSEALTVAKAASEPTESITPPQNFAPSGGGGGKVSIAVTGTSVSAGTTENTGVTQETDTSFNDLASVSWAETHIKNLHDKGIVTGKGDGRFAPHDPVTREEFVTMVVRMFNLAATGGSSFTDVAEDAWYKKAVDAAVDSGIISGVSAESFGAGLPVSRQDCATICARILSYLGVETEGDAASFVDDDTIADYAKDAVYKMKRLGIINGMDDNRFNPNGTCTRAMAAKIIDMLGGVTS